MVNKICGVLLKYRYKLPEFEKESKDIELLLQLILDAAGVEIQKVWKRAGDFSPELLREVKFYSYCRLTNILILYDNRFFFKISLICLKPTALCLRSKF